MIAERTRYTFPNTTETEPGWLSPSQVTEWLRCPACYELSRIRKLPRPLSVNLPIGSALHKAVEEARLGNLNVHQSIETAADWFDKETSQPTDEETGQPLDILEIDLGTKYSDLGQVKDEVVRLAEFTVPRILKLDAQRGKLAATEWNLSYLESPWPFTVHGRLDAIFVDYLADASKPELATVMADLKSSSKQQEPDEFTAIAQTIYQLYWSSRGLPLAVLADVVSKAKEPSLQTYALVGDDDSRKLTYDTVMQVADSISAGRFPPHPNWSCSYLHGFSEFKAAATGFPE